MNTPTDRDYINAKAEATAATLSADAKEYQAKTNARLDVMDKTMQFGFKSVQDEFAIQIAQLESRILRSQAESLKWIVGSIIGGIAISTSISAVLINNVALKVSSPAPAVYTQPSQK